ncbi:hypothetical protein OESDEN_06340 [Oesophagostomum dentatum]|uniref:Peptidase M12A domain-containing protein n=1 Tax=Oesophagostomum dentatum TaxID=61180 RepID=A0A0B1T934_OESDE|nr:hypothetical protein OESDEN_06340 [Oesophagostomum dentatum]
MIPRDVKYLRTLGSRSISFYDIKTINDHYSCNVLLSGSTTSHKYAKIISNNFDILALCDGGSVICAHGGEPNPRNCTVCNCPAGYGGDLCNKRAPAGKRIQIRVTYMSQLKCGTGCRVNSIEPKKLEMFIFRICCADMLYKVHTSALNPTPVVSYNRLLTTTFTFHYRYIS